MPCLRNGRIINLGFVFDEWYYENQHIIHFSLNIWTYLLLCDLIFGYELNLLAVIWTFYSLVCTYFWLWIAYPNLLASCELIFRFELNLLSLSEIISLDTDLLALYYLNLLDPEGIWKECILRLHWWEVSVILDFSGFV